VSNGATLRLAAGINLAESAITLNGLLQNFGQTNSMAGALTLRSSNSPLTAVFNSQLTLNGAIVGTGGLQVTDAGVLQLSGSASNTFTGGTFVNNSGVLVLNKTIASQAIPGPLTISGSVRLGNITQINDS